MTHFAFILLNSQRFLTTLLSAFPLFFSPNPLPMPDAEKPGPSVQTGGDAAEQRLSLSEPRENGLFMSFEFTFPDSTGTVEIRLEGEFVEVEENWTSDNSSTRWGARNSRLVFDNREKTLTVINEDDNAYTLITEAVMDRVRNDLSAHRPMEQNSLMSHTSQVQDESDADTTDNNPTYIVIPEKPHPGECRAYERPLPRGLHEESCYTPWRLAGVKPARLDALKSLRQFVRGLDKPLSELGVIAAISDALAWDLGLVVSHYKYGKSPLSPNDSGPELDPWDRIFTLKEVRPQSFKPADLMPPKSATKEYGIVPWPTPLINL